MIHAHGVLQLVLQLQVGLILLRSTQNHIGYQTASDEPVARSSAVFTRPSSQYVNSCRLLFCSGNCDVP